MTMKTLAFLLLASIPLVSGRLGTQKEGSGNINSRKALENETFFAANEIVPMFQSEDHPAIDLLDFDENDANAPFEITTPLNTAKNATSLQDSRELESVRSVTIINQCTEQGFFLAIIYREEATGEMVHRGWYNVPSFHRVTFDDVLDGNYSMYALSHDFRFDWGEDPNKASHCFNERCYRDFSYPDSNSWQYLSCNSGSQPTPAPSPPTPAPVYNIPLTDREQQWVDAHNSRRQTIHSQYGKSFKPVQWSSSLADSAQGYADKLASVTATDCYIAHGYQGDSYGGENIASNWGSSSYDFESPEAVLTRWFENEADDEWPQNGHRTQVAWRGTNYVGCGEARKLYNGNLYCKIQVCRYLAPGNCNVGSKPLDDLMMDDYSACSPQRPSS